MTAEATEDSGVKRLLVLLLLVVGLVASAAGSAQASTSTAVGGLKRQLQAAFAGSTSRTPGVAIDVAGIGAVYRSQSGTSLAPASTEKLFTSFAALRALGATSRYTTSVLATVPQVGADQPGNLYLIGVGDPSLGTADLDRMAAGIAATGTKRLMGRLYVDDYRYDHVTRGPQWKAEFVPEESGPLSAFAVDGNGYRTDRAYLADPALGNLARFRSLLVKHGVAVSATLGRAKVGSGRIVSQHVSRPLSDIVKGIAKNSDNFGAELLAKELGKVRRNAGSTKDGALVIRDVLHAMGVTVGTVIDGSGLSYSNRQTVNGVLTLLAAAERSNVYAELRAALPVACTDGTLKKRMCGTAASGIVTAKTGTLDVVHALAGWTTTRDGRVVRFAFLLQSFSSGAKANAAMDAAAVALSAADLR
ncbi:MAG: D-alanyl-D-alanine carboxypeptidase/D-alanyl-D-alanine-endopeptidase [Frankiales bacterium]|nr:D-alanyl-D-alanine carboxypeptidase/D-alanyl-D-alanine-endopeptidase [Frankiales bacterium]